MIAIKEINNEDKVEFTNFLKGKRYELPELEYANLPYPHSTILIAKNYNLNNSAGDYIISKCPNRVDIDSGTTVYSEDGLKYGCDGDGIFFFSGYLIKENKLFFGFNEIKNCGLPLRELYECYGEYVLARFYEGKVELSSDYFGMSPWFYYNKDNIFLASNHYHLLLEVLSRSGIELFMDIDRSSVNLITSGFMYGSAFSKRLDIKNCYLNLPYEVITVDNDNLSIRNTQYFTDITTPDKWDEDMYEEYLRKAKDEIYNNTYALCNHDNFNEIILDVSGGFDSRVVFATANCLPKRLRKKFKIHTRNSGTLDDIEKASMVTNLYNYERVSYPVIDNAEVMIEGKLNICQISRTLGFYSLNTSLYLSNYVNRTRLQITGYLGEVVFGYKRVRGELQYSLGDQRLLARLGGSYLWNSVKELDHVFESQKKIINEVLDDCKYDELFKKFHVFYSLFRNRFICGSSHNVEYDNIRVSPLHSRYALKAKWMYFNKFSNNAVPDEKISLDILNLINPIMTKIPFASENDDVISKPDNLLSPINLTISPNSRVKEAKPLYQPLSLNASYKEKVRQVLQDLKVAKQMILKIYDYSNDYYNVCLGLFKIINEFEKHPDDLASSHGMEQIRKIYDVYFQVQYCKKSIFN